MLNIGPIKTKLLETTDEYIIKFKCSRTLNNMHVNILECMANDLDIDLYIIRSYVNEFINNIKNVFKDNLTSITDNEMHINKCFSNKTDIKFKINKQIEHLINELFEINDKEN